jgi:hypothetical protein
MALLVTAFSLLVFDIVATTWLLVRRTPRWTASRHRARRPLVAEVQVAADRLAADRSADGAPLETGPGCGSVRAFGARAGTARAGGLSPVSFVRTRCGAGVR